MANYEPWQHAGHFLFGDDMLLFDMVVYAVFAATLNIRNFLEIVRQQELDASKLNQPSPSFGCKPCACRSTRISCSTR